MRFEEMLHNEGGCLPGRNGQPRQTMTRQARNTHPLTRHPLALAAALTMLFAAVACSSTDPAADGTPGTLPEATSEQLQSVLDDARAEFGFPGIIAGVLSPSGSWVGFSGTAGAGSEEPVTPGHHTRIGSVTKTFTGTVLLQQVEQGTMSLDDPIEKYVPGLPNGATATLRDLAQMTSGIPSYTQVEAWQYDFFTEVDRVFTAEELLAYVSGTPALFPPGTRFDYSNSNTVALGLAIERATGRPFGDLLTEGVLEPLGLDGTSWPGTSPELPTPFLSGQTEQGLPENAVKDATRWNPSWADAAGKMVSTFDDLLVWARALGTGEGILSKQTQALRMNSFDDNLAIEGNDPTGIYGIGVGLIDGWVGHTGELPGYNTSVLYRRETDTVVVVMVNSDIASAEGANPAPTVSERIRNLLPAGD